MPINIVEKDNRTKQHRLISILLTVSGKIWSQKEEEETEGQIHQGIRVHLEKLCIPSCCNNYIY